MVGRPSDGVRGSRARALLGVGAVVLLLLTVAVASTSSVPVGTGGTRPPSERFLDVFVSMVLVWMAFGSVMIIVLLLLRKGAIDESTPTRRKRSRRESFAYAAVAIVLAAIFVRMFWVDGSVVQVLADRLRPDASDSEDASTPTPGGYEAEFATGPVLIVVGLLVVAVAAWYFAYRARRRSLGPLEGPVLPALADVLDETLDDLRAETDPRRAVIGAYVRMERALGAYGFPRDPSEAPEEYLQRILTDLDVSKRATSRLTALFAWAKFSSHDVAPEMKEEAIEALEAVREELRAAEILAEHQRELALAELRERADG